MLRLGAIVACLVYYTITRSSVFHIGFILTLNFQVSRNSVSEGIAVDLSSRKRLEVNITHSFIETALSILDTFDRQKNVSRIHICL